MVMNMNPFYSQQQPNLGQVNDATLMALSQQGNPNFSHAALMEQAAAQQVSILSPRQSSTIDGYTRR